MAGGGLPRTPVLGSRSLQQLLHSSFPLQELIGSSLSAFVCRSPFSHSSLGDSQLGL